MNSEKDEVLRSIREQGVEAEEISEEATTRLLRTLASKFGKGEAGEYLWEHLQDSVAVRHERAWECIGELVGNAATLMLFRPSRSKSGIRFTSGAAVGTVLADTYHFEFYLTDESASYLLCFNHHDFLIAAGTAKPRLRSEAKKRDWPLT